LNARQDSSSKTDNLSDTVAKATLPPQDERYVLSIHIGASSYHVGVLSTSGKVISKEVHLDKQDSRSQRAYLDLLDEAVGASLKVIEKAKSAGVTPDMLWGPASSCRPPLIRKKVL